MAGTGGCVSRLPTPRTRFGGPHYRRRGGRREAHRHGVMTVVIVACAAVLVVAGFALVRAARNTPVVEGVLYPLEYTDEISDAAARHEVNPYWICAMIKCESSWDPDATSSAGAMGLMQVQPETAADLVAWGLVDGNVYSPDNLYDPETNIEFGTAYLRYLVERYHQMQPAIAAYNAGPGNVDEWLAQSDNVVEAIDFEETSNYLTRVEDAKAHYEEMYPDAFPGYVSEG